MGAAGSGVPELCGVGAEWHDFCSERKEAFFFWKSEHLCSPLLREIPLHPTGPCSETMKRGRYSHLFSQFSLRFLKTNRKWRSSWNDSTDSSSNIRTTLGAHISSACLTAPNDFKLTRNSTSSIFSHLLVFFFSTVSMQTTPAVSCYRWNVQNNGQEMV